MIQFKVGNMVVHSEGIGIIKRYEPSLVLSPLFVKFEHCSLWIKTSEIKCVRSPRKGGKEARDIVAMLKADYRKARSAKKNDNESEFSRGVRCANKLQKRIICEKAKSMLKEGL